MASCTQVDSLVQAYVDGELRDSERAILEQHLSDCAACRKVLREHRATAALMFEALAPHQLSGDLTPAVLSHLPHMDHVQSLAQEATWRIKNPRRATLVFRALVPALAPMLLFVLGFAIYMAWPEAESAGRVVGMVVHRDGGVLRSHDDSTLRHAVALESRVTPDERFETDRDSTLMINLAGPSQVKVDHNTRVKIVDTRAVNVEAGRVWLNVCKAREKFRVTTPLADIIVFGTQFAVDVNGNRTVVTVSEGEVTVEQGERFAVLHAGEELEVRPQAEPFTVREVPVAKVMAWTRRVQPDAVAQRRFETEIPSPASKVVRAYQVYRLDAGGRAVEAITLSWDAGPVGDRAGYDIYVFDDRMRPLVREHVSASVFNDPARSEYKLVLMPDGEPITNAGVLNIRTVPDFTEGRRETSFREIATHIY